MRRVILASRSKARQKLLRDIGIKFTVAVSGIKEKRAIKTNCGDLVMENAHSKAKDVAKRFDSGVVIAADTVVLVGKRIIGKPRNIKDAFRTLKLLSRKPQWVYTGIAVIDIDNNKEYLAFDRTKVYMYHLTDRMIRNYFRRVSPLDKAGSFDIQGFGSVFIDRIEGCFYNVVGLPMAKLAKVLKKAGIIFFISFFLGLACYAHAECYNEDACYKDYINNKDKEVIVAVNRDTKQVELYWSEKDNTWLKPDKGYQEELQKIYSKKIQLQEMQARLDRMRNDTMFNTDQGGSGRR